MTRWYQHRYHTLFSHRLVFGIIPRLPKLLHPPIAVVTALIFFVLLRNERRALVSNLRHICGGGGLYLRWKAYCIFYSFCDFMVSYCYVPKASRDYLRSMLVVPDDGGNLIEQCLREGQGLIVWTAHLGNWEFASRLLELHGRPVNVARVVDRKKAAEMMLRDLMVNEHLRIVELNEDGAAPLKLLHALRANEIVAIQGDRVYQPFSAKVRFCGSEVAFPLGPFLLSYVSGAPVLPGMVVRQRWLRYRVIMGAPIWLPHTGDQENDLRAGLGEAVGFLEQVVKAHPDQWLNFYEFWPSQPLAEPSTNENAVVAHESKL